MLDVTVLNRLKSDTSITALIADRIWTTWLPERTKLPAVTCNYVADNPINTLTLDTGKSREVVTINVWADNKSDAVDIVGLVRLRLSGFAVRQQTTDLSDEEQKEFRYALDYSIFG